MDVAILVNFWNDNTYFPTFYLIRKILIANRKKQEIDYTEEVETVEATEQIFDEMHQEDEQDVEEHGYSLQAYKQTLKHRADCCFKLG